MTPSSQARTAEDWYDRVPKTELHLHLEGAIPHQAMWTLVQQAGGDDLVPNLEALVERFKFRDFAHFIEVWQWKNKFLRTYDDLAFIAEAVANDLIRQNVRYAEVFFSPSRFADQGLDPLRLTVAIRSGLDRAQGIEVALIPDLVRDHGPKRADLTLSQMNEVREHGLVGIGMGGSEQRFPPEPFARVFERARELGFRTTVHAGEAAGADSVWGALRVLHVDRVGHATRAIEDPQLIDFLARRHTPLELCPLSNVRTRVIARLRDHPLKRFLRAGLNITVNTDDPAMFGNSLAEELRALETVFGLSRTQVKEVILAGIHGSWLSQPRKAALANEFRSDPGWSDG